MGPALLGRRAQRKLREMLHAWRNLRGAGDLQVRHTPGGGVTLFVPRRRQVEPKFVAKLTAIENDWVVGQRIDADNEPTTDKTFKIDRGYGLRVTTFLQEISLDLSGVTITVVDPQQITLDYTLTIAATPRTFQETVRVATPLAVGDIVEVERAVRPIIDNDNQPIPYVLANTHPPRTWATDDFQQFT